MSPMRSVILLLGVLGVLALAGCNSERKQECDKLLTALKPIDDASPSSSTLGRMQSDIAANQFQDHPLSVYARNYERSLTVLEETTKLKEGPSPPEGTDDLLKTQLQKARTDRDDITRYCSQ
jgi:outer membrane murein-binding lipoprotein Lpp